MAGRPPKPLPRRVSEHFTHSERPVSQGLSHLMRVELQPIETVGKSFWSKRYTALRESRRMVYLENWYFQLPTGEWCVIPAGYGPDGDKLQDAFDTDGSSFPRITRPVFTPWGISVGAGVPHDFAYRFQCLLLTDGSLYHEGMTKREADDLFKRLNLQINDIPELAYTTWAALKMFGLPAWHQHRGWDGTHRNDVSMYQEVLLNAN